MNYLYYEVVTKPLKVEKPKLKPMRKDFDNAILYGEALDKYEKDLSVYESARSQRSKERSIESSRLHKKFKEDLYEDVGWENLPKEIQDKLYNFCQENSSEGSFYEIHHHAVDLMDITEALVNHGMEKVMSKC